MEHKQQEQSLPLNQTRTETQTQKQTQREMPTTPTTIIDPVMIIAENKQILATAEELLETKNKHLQNKMNRSGVFNSDNVHHGMRSHDSNNSSLSGSPIRF